MEQIVMLDKLRAQKEAALAAEFKKQYSKLKSFKKIGIQVQTTFNNILNHGSKPWNILEQHLDELGLPQKLSVICTLRNIQQCMKLLPEIREDPTLSDFANLKRKDFLNIHGVSELQATVLEKLFDFNE